ncbi:MAG: HupE/UreJ family protein [Planctomycetaceae bacterium]
MNVLYRSIPFVVFGIALLTGSTAFAHPHHVVHEHVNGFESGFLHPMLGLDHLLAMLTVGLLAARAGGRAQWLMPVSFLLFMVLGGAIAFSGRPIFGIETGIALSVVLLGLAVAAGRDQPLALMLGACGVFGFFHGHAHGAEMPSIADPAQYAAGFVLATAGLHLAGILAGRFLTRSETRRNLLRLSGAAIALVGVALLLR